MILTRFFLLLKMVLPLFEGKAIRASGIEEVGLDGTARIKDYYLY